MKISRFYTQDAQQKALVFLTNQAQRIEQAVYQTKYTEIQYPQLVPVDTTGPDWVTGVTYFSADMVGRAQWFHGRGDDVPHAEVTREKFETTISMAAIGYDYDLQELGQAMQAGVDLRPEKGTAARRAAEEMIDRVAMFGDTTKGYYGLVNQPTVPTGPAASNGNSNGGTNSPLWQYKTADQILGDVNAALTGQFNATYGAEMSDTILLPYSRLLTISTMRIDAYNTQTVLDWIGENNIYTRQTNQALTLRGVWGLDTAGSGGTARMVTYRKAPDVVTLYMPMPFQFLPVWQQGPMKFEVPGIFRISGVEARRPLAMKYVDGL
jgi:hypothetical protein